MRMLSALMVVLICLCAAGCRDSQDHHAQDHEQDVEQNAEHDSAGHALHLNNGSRWEANPETTAGIQKMKQLMNDYETPDSTEARALHPKLLEPFNTIIEQCTMKGEAHNQLHLYLMPLSGSIAALETCGEDCQTVIEDINIRLEQYDAFFE